MNDRVIPPAPLEIPITLTVAYTGFGGNTHHGQYFYSFSPQMILVGKGQHDMRMRYLLHEDVPERFKIHALLSSDSQNQIYSIRVAGDRRSVSFLNRNNRNTLIFFSIVVIDEKLGVIFGCDPQVGNDPEIDPVPAV